MSDAHTSMSISGAYVKVMRTISLDTTPEQVDPTGSGFLCPSSTHLALQVKSIFKSQIRCPVTLEHPTGEFCTSGKTSNATPTLCILVALASLQKLLPFYFLILCQCLMLVGI